MNNELNTLPTTPNVFLTDRVLPDLGYTRSGRPGRKVRLDDAELLCLVVAQQLLHGSFSESRWIRYARAHLRGHFPQIPYQSGYNKRVREPVHSSPRQSPPWPGTHRLGTKSCASWTRPRSHAACHFRLYLISTPEGMPVIWRLANPKFGEREVTQALLTNDHRLIRSGQVILGDKGFAGRDFERFITEDLGATLVRPDRATT